MGETKSKVRFKIKKLPIEKILPVILCIILPVMNAVTTKGMERIFLGFLL